jgi:two-component system, OmpR family, sensor kinase
MKDAEHPASDRGPSCKIVPTPGRQLVRGAFALVAVGVLLVTISTLVQVRALQGNARDIVQNMLASVRLVGQLAMLIERRRILVDDHIFASAPTERKTLEAELATVDEEIAETSRAYEPWITLPNERPTWNRTRADLAVLDWPIARALALSRQNRDSEARAEMQLVSEQFVAVGRDCDQLISINDRAASDTLTRFSMIRLRLVWTLIATGLGALLATFFLGRWASRQVARREDETLRQRQALEDRNRELDAFAARVAHDLRGPLTSMTLATDRLALRVREEKRPLESLQRGLLQMGALVEDLLTLSRLDAQAGGSCDPATVVVEIEEEFGPRLAAHQGALRVSVTPAQVLCAAGHLRQALMNLVENAIKYRRLEATPEVEITGQTSGGGYDLCVTDNGRGMSEEDAARAFDPFYRSPQIRDLPGTGLGLSIVKRVAQASGGTITVRTQPGQGSMFAMKLPLAGRPESGSPPARADGPAV